MAQGCDGDSTRGRAEKAAETGGARDKENGAQEELQAALPAAHLLEGLEHPILRREDSGSRNHSSHNFCNQPGLREEVPQFSASLARGFSCILIAILIFLVRVRVSCCVH